MFIRPNPTSGVPIYLQLMDQIKHAIETGALRPGDQLPGMRKVAVDLVMNPNTVAKSYRELEHEGVIELRQGSGAFVCERKPTDRIQKAQPVARQTVERMVALGLDEGEIRRLVEAELQRWRAGSNGR